MPTSVLYIHGFASCGQGNKSRLLSQHYGDDWVSSPDLPVAPADAIHLLQDIIEQKRIDLLVGASLGGYYAEYLNGKFAIPTVLINPSTRPFDTLAAYLGSNTNWCSGEQFAWPPEYLQQLQQMYRHEVPLDERYLVLLQTADDVLDYELAARRYEQQQVIVERGGNHRFENLGDYLEIIDNFIDASSHQKTRYSSSSP